MSTQSVNPNSLSLAYETAIILASVYEKAVRFMGSNLKESIQKCVASTVSDVGVVYDLWLMMREEQDFGFPFGDNPKTQDYVGRLAKRIRKGDELLENAKSDKHLVRLLRLCEGGWYRGILRLKELGVCDEDLLRLLAQGSKSRSLVLSSMTSKGGSSAD